ncbi:serine/threonine-protein kinase PINK1, mitochondrial-like isoform X2 [Dreissena polymorpha]|uniref:serine/threonine-protein kinase PINK1, mitochondrial-like isoform X2 n=1 Tax=Dreissena polymorpha TaxID=45954 RepID=UPI002264AD61|nr:serine/threonine-protein kinase PINK1, mitochondrial-like isoform X2 [Dreissena polymorpha]
MAPEVATAEPGRFVQLDYRKADAWSAGAVAYEVFGADNRFYNIGHGRLDSRSYMLDELLPLSDYVPDVVQRVVAALLERESKNVQCEILALFLNNGDYIDPLHGRQQTLFTFCSWRLPIGCYHAAGFQGQRSGGGLSPWQQTFTWGRSQRCER